MRIILWIISKIRFSFLVRNHDRSVSQEGVFEIAVRAIKAAQAAGFGGLSELNFSILQLNFSLREEPQKP